MPLSKLELLLIEDNEGDATLVREYLAEDHLKQFRIEHVLDLSHALTRIKETSFDLIVLDLMLPDSTGIATLHQVHEATPHTPVVVLSGFQDDDLGQHVIQSGAQDFLHKNDLTADSLARSLRYASERGRLQGQVRSIVENNADAIVVIRDDGMITFANQAAERLFARSRDRMVGQPFGYPVQAGTLSEITIDLPDQEQRAAEMRTVPIEWESESAWLASLRDITDRKQSEELQRRLYHADRLASIGQLASGVAHEVNNPASFIQGNLGIMKEQLPKIEAAIKALQNALQHDPHAEPLPPELTEQLDEMLVEMNDMVYDNLVGIKRITSIVKGLGNFSYIGRDEVNWIDVNESLEVACTMTFNEIRHRARLTKEFGQLPKIPADRNKLAQVFTNLLINAAHSVASGPSDRNFIRVVSRVENQQILVSIEDSGCGISKENLGRIFTPFFTTKPHGKGTGLGLPLSADIIRKHGGELQVESTIGKGSIFTVALPVNSPIAHGLSKPPPVPNPAPIETARILLIDDERMLLDSFSRMLQRRHKITTADGGMRGIEALEAGHHYDVVLCDLMMPEVDGVRFYRMVEERWPSVLRRIVFCSGGVFSAHARNFLEQVEASNIVIEKPFQPRELLEAVDKVLKRHGRFNGR